MKKELKSIEQLMEILNETELTNISYEKDGFKIKLKKAAIAQELEVTTELKEEIAVEHKEVKAKNIGKFIYVDKAGQPMIKLGDKIVEGQEIGYVATMGVKSPVKSEVKGTIREILIENGEVADYGRPLIKVEV